MTAIQRFIYDAQGDWMPEPRCDFCGRVLDETDHYPACEEPIEATAALMLEPVDQMDVAA